MTRKLVFTALSLALGVMTSTALAGDRSSPSAMPKILPMSSPAPELPSAAPDVTGKAMMMAPAMSKPAEADAVIDALTAVKAHRNGKTMEVPLPNGIRMMLKFPVKEGKITPKPGGGKMVQIKDTTQFPYATMGLLGSGCSGTLVAGRFVITAAMCIYDSKAKKFYDNLDFFPGINGKDQPFGAYKWVDAYVPKGYTENGALEYDFGLVVLEEGSGDKTGWMGMGHLDNFNLKQVTLTGYPWEGVPGQTMWQAPCDMQSAEDNFLFYKCAGESKPLAAMTGSAIWYKGETDEDWKILGIHNYAQDDKKNSWWALRLNQANMETILSWVDDANKNGGGKQTDNGDNGDGGDNGDTGNGGGNGGGNGDCTCGDN